VPATIVAESLSKQFLLRHNRSPSLKSRLLGVFYPHQRETLEKFLALDNVSLVIDKGDTVGLIGRNGSGKSTFLKLIAGIHRPTSGHLRVSSDARIGTMIELGVGFHPDLNGTENVFLGAAIHGLSRPQIEELYPRVVEYSGLKHFMDAPIKNYSSGMQMRLGFALAANLNPDILLLDEVFAVGDADFQHKCTETMRMFAERGCTIVFVSHSGAAIRSICRRVCLLERGRLVYDGDVHKALAEYDRVLAGAVPDDVEARSAAADDAEQREVLKEMRLSQWSLDFLRREGLRPHHRVVEMGFSPMAQPSAIAQFVEPGKYSYWYADATAPDGTESADFVIASSVFRYLTLNAIGRLLTIVRSHVPPACRCYATFFEASGIEVFSPVARPNGITSFHEQPPHHYSYALLEGVSGAVGLRAAQMNDRSHPDGESIVLFEKVP
jgi:ABC-2 type transport system ATP-binding protein/lipopolysaccharide transport system ATP-binding protein